MDLEWVLDSVLTLPSGRRLKIHSESDLADAAAEVQAADDAYMTEDLGGWTGGSTWAAGEVLARLLMTPPWAERVKGARVIDLGCGTGLAGVVAAALGAERVSLTDRVLAVAEHNLRANFSAEERERYTASRLSWGDDAAIVMNKAIPFIREQAKAKKPFLAVIWFHNVHTYRYILGNT